MYKLLCIAIISQNPEKAIAQNVNNEELFGGSGTVVQGFHILYFYFP